MTSNRRQRTRRVRGVAFPGRRRAIALVLVLMVLVVATTAVAAAARLSIAARMHESIASASSQADAIRRGAEGHIDRFLRERSHRVVLAPDAEVPGLLIIDDQLPLPNDRLAHVRIVAFDQCGLVPWTEARAGFPLRAVLEPAHLRAWQRASAESERSGGPPGLDLLASAARSHDLPVFPADAAASDSAAIGARLATHNPEPPPIGGSARFTGTPLINVNTAPRDLLAAALQTAGASGLEEILNSRGEARQAAAPQIRTPGDSRLRLVAQSNAWAFRIDVRIGSVSRAWWCVYRSTGSEWRCVQRVAIDE